MHVNCKIRPHIGEGNILPNLNYGKSLTTPNAQAQWFFMLKWQCVVPEIIHTTPMDGICHMTPLPSGFSEIGPQSLPPIPSGISQIFPYTPWYAISNMKERDK